MVHRIAKGMMFVRDKETKEAELEEIQNLLPEEDIKINSSVQNIYTGATMSLFSTGKGNWYIKYSSRDLGYFGKDVKTAKGQFMKMAGTEGELI